jgi:PD-(D/E)XK nuclease superfamily
VEHGINRLAESISELCTAHLYEEKWLLAPSLRAGFQWLDTVTRSGRPVINARIKTVAAMALELAAPEMQRQGLSLLRGMRSELLVDGVLARLRAGGGYLARLEASPGLVRAAVSTLGALRRCGLAVGDLSPRLFEVAAKGRELISMLAAYEEELASRDLIDLAGVMRLAARRLQTDAAALPPGCLVAAPQDMLENLRGLERLMWEAVPTEKRLVLAADRPCEERAGGSSDSALLAWTSSPREAPFPPQDGSVKMFRAVGEVNEVREVLRRCSSAGIPFDEVEVLYTDTATYVPLIYEVCSALAAEEGDGGAATFAEGIPVRFSRPGRALAAWLSWIEDDFPQSTLVRMVQEGLLAPGTDLPDGWSFSRLGSILRALPVGKGRERYLAAIDAELDSLAWRQEHPAREEDVEEEATRRQHLEQRAKMLGVLRKLVEELLEGIPTALQEGMALLGAVEAFLVARARVVSELDDYSRLRLLDEIRELASSLEEDGKTFACPDALVWLLDIAGSTSVEGKGPRPGCIYVAPLAGGGHSGRPHTFIVGLDDGRFPGAGLQDPLLLDSERTAISPDLTTAAERLAASLEDFARLAARLRGAVTLSYCCRSLSDDHDMFPSPVMLAAYRIITGDREGVQDDLLAWLPEPASFAPRDPEHCIDISEWWLRRLCGDPAPQDPEETVALAFPHLGRGMEARRARQSDLFTAYDGYVPEAGEDLDPAKPGGPVLSARRLRMLGSCPLEYFLAYILGVKPLEEYKLDPSMWLEPTEKGDLLHAVFREFMMRLRGKGLRPKMDRDWPLLHDILEKEIYAWSRSKPPPNREVFEMETADLQKTARIFLIEEELFCGNRQPLYFEAAIGLEPNSEGDLLDTPEPVEIELPGGKKIRGRGRIDRVDEVEGVAGTAFAICDYKTGSSGSYDPRKPFQQGRNVQSVFYLALVGSRLRDCHPGAEVISFGYFFPSSAGHGKRIEWCREELGEGMQILASLCEMLTLGCFPFTNKKDDVRYSDYQAAFGDVKRAADDIERKMSNPENDMLSPFRDLRATRKGR